MSGSKQNRFPSTNLENIFNLAASYRQSPSLVSATSSSSVCPCSTFLPTVEDILSQDQAGFRNERSTCEQVAALTSYTESRFQQNLKTGAICAIFLDLTAAYDTIWHTGLLFKLSKSMPYYSTSRLAS